MATDKLIVTNIGALKAKYGARLAAVRKALATLAAADRARGLSTKLVAIDSAAQMRAAGGRPVNTVRDQRGAKAAIDVLYRKHRPHYLLILGAQDVVPHVALTNPISMQDDPDEDAVVPSDLPYACEAPWSRDPARFLGPTRVIGRVPDEVGASDPALLLKLLAIAARHQARERALYDEPFVLSAKSWRASTQLSVRSIFGASTPVITSPPHGPSWTRAQLAPRVHFINCHGGTLSPLYQGEERKRVNGEDVPAFHDAHHSTKLRAKVSEGTVIAAECCYGAALYDPLVAQDAPAICTTYLSEGAYGFFGSTTIAYGPSEGNGQADLICRYFVEAVLAGSSLGRAAVEARQRFIAQFSHLDPSDLKTAAQFLLLGDPSVHAVCPAAHALARSRAVARATRSGSLRPGARNFRRERIVRTGRNLARTVGAAVPSKQRTPAAVLRLLEELALESGLRDATHLAYRVAFPSGAKAVSSPEIESSRRARTVHVLKGRRAQADDGNPAWTALIATVEGREVVHLRRVHSR